jgi:hypothetical protein
VFRSVGSVLLSHLVFGGDPDCGKRYAEQYVVNDCGIWCDPSEVDTALGKLRNLRKAIIALWNKVLAIEEARQSWPFYTEWGKPVDAWLARDEFPAKYGTWEGIKYGEQETFNRIRDVARDGVCLLDRMVTHAEKLYGSEQPHLDPAPPPFEPPPPEPWIPTGGGSMLAGAGAVLALVVLALLLARGGAR